MDNFANNDPSGRLEGHFHDPQTGQKRPADQADSSSSPNGNWGSFKHIKQEHSSEGQQVGFSDQISRLGEQSLSHNHHYVSPAITDPSTNYMLYPISNQHHDPFFQYPSHPSEEPQYTSTIQTNELTSGQVFSELHDLQSSNITTMPAQTYALQNEHYEYQKETSSRVDDREARFRDENEYKRVCSENEKLRKDLETLQHQCQKLCDENAVLQSSKPQSTPDEEEIIRHWEILKHAINNLATQKFHGYPLKRATKENQDLFKPLTPNFDHYLMKGPKALLIEAAIWRMLVDNFLHSPSLVYQTAAGDSIRAVEQANRRKSLQLHQHLTLISANMTTRKFSSVKRSDSAIVLYVESFDRPIVAHGIWRQWSLWKRGTTPT